MSARAGIVVTGTEVLAGRVRDRNGPWLYERLLEQGVELAHVTICGDRPDDIEAALRFHASQGVDLIVTSGGLGPTADDMTVEIVARFCGRPLFLDEELEAKIYSILEPLMKRFTNWEPEAVREANRKQALIPEGAEVIDPVGTAPGVIVPGKPAVLVLPGPPRELQPMWKVAVASPILAEALAGRTEYDTAMVRMFGVPESELASTLRDASGLVSGFDSLEITTCLRRGEIEMVTRYEPESASTYAALVEVLREKHGGELFSEDGSSIDDQVAALLSGRLVATAESCTAGLLAARLTERPGSSAYVAGGVVAYANEAKVELLGVPGGVDRAARSGLRGGGEGDGGRGARAVPGRTSRSRSRGSRARTGGARRSPWALCAGACASLTGPRASRGGWCCRATGATSATARPRWRCICCGGSCPEPSAAVRGARRAGGGAVGPVGSRPA